MRTISIQVYHRATGKAVERPFEFDPQRPLVEVVAYMINYIAEGNEMTDDEVRATYRFEIVL